jgi:hypothetical protein
LMGLGRVRGSKRCSAAATNGNERDVEFSSSSDDEISAAHRAAASDADAKSMPRITC